MANKRLSDKVIAARMVELRNLRKLHAASRKREVLKDTRIQELEVAFAGQQSTIESLLIQVAELQTMVFGKKKRPPTGTPVPKDDIVTTQKLPRTKDSYRRPVPPATAITATEVISIVHCQCGGELAQLTTHTRYQEDIPLAELTPDYTPHLVTKYLVQRGICQACGKVTSGKDLGGQAVTLGPNARLLICHLVSVMGMSYTQVAHLLLSLYGLRVTDGEIALVLSKQHQTWLPVYETLRADIRSSPAVHVDETPWAIQQNDGLGHAWSLSDGFSERVCYSLENSRGVVHARNLFGAQFSGVRISDDYGAYRSLPGVQQLCWAHLYRTIRDLCYNDNLPEDQSPYVTWWYEQFAGLYQDLRSSLDKPYNCDEREQQSTVLWQRLQTLLPADESEPKKLAKLKAQLTRAGPTKLFACLVYDTPCDNNRAERDLRQLVLKRKRSFGSQTEKGAKTLSTILSICTTTWRSNPTGYFKALAELG